MIVKSLDAITAFVAGDHTLLKEVLHQKNDSLTLGYSLAFASLEPNQSSTPHILKESSELYIIVQGTGTAYVEGEPIPLKPGKVVFIEAGEKQYVTNTGAETLGFYCVVSPPWNKNDEVILNEDTTID